MLKRAIYNPPRPALQPRVGHTRQSAMPKRTLRSNFEYGTSRWAARRAQWRALGMTDADMEKPKIAVVNTSSELSSCFSHLDQVSKVVKQAIREAGGWPLRLDDPRRPVLGARIRALFRNGPGGGTGDGHGPGGLLRAGSN